MKKKSLNQPQTISKKCQRKVDYRLAFFVSRAKTRSMAAPEKPDDLPHDLNSALRFNAELIKTVEQPQKASQQLRDELNLYRRKLFGQSASEDGDDDEPDPVPISLASPQPRNDSFSI